MKYALMAVLSLVLGAAPALAFTPIQEVRGNDVDVQGVDCDNTSKQLFAASETTNTLKITFYNESNVGIYFCPYTTCTAALGILVPALSGTTPGALAITASPRDSAWSCITASADDKQIKILHEKNIVIATPTPSPTPTPTPSPTPTPTPG